MNSKDITNLLYRKFDSHKYALSNSFLYSWEADFHSITSTGYAQEVEIKTTYSDFKADFKKLNKHQELLHTFNDNQFKTEFVYRNYRVKSPETEYRGRINPSTTYMSREKSGKQEAYWRKNNYEFEWINSEIDYVLPGLCPNKFYYICPTDVIPLKEVPEYAGLYYVSESGRITTKKRAPFIHKEKQNLDKILLDKFYWLSINLKNKLR